MLARNASWSGIKLVRYNTTFLTNHLTSRDTNYLTYWYSQTSTAYFTSSGWITSHLTNTEFNRITIYVTTFPTSYNTTRETWKSTTWW